MIRSLRPRSIYDVLAALGFFIALATGSAYAANTVFSTDIVDGQVKAPDIAQGAVLTDEIANGQVKGADIGDGEVKAADIGAGAVGAAEITDAAVGTGEIANGSILGADVGDNTLKGADIDESSLSLAGSGASKVVIRGTYLPTGIGTAHCNPGEVATGGGAGADLPNESHIGRSEPDPNSGVPTGWTASIWHADGTPASGSVFVLCASP